MSESYRKKLIEVALPLQAINLESAREKSIRHGHPSTLHLWWSRKPLSTCRAVLFASLVDDPSSRPEEFPTEEAQERERQRLFRIIEQLVKWENSNNETVLSAARAEIMKSTNGNPPPVLDPFCGGGSIPLEAQRLGLEAYGSDLNPVAVLITKALIEIPPKFAGRPPVNPEARRRLAGEWKGAKGLAEDVRYYGKWMRDEAYKRIGHLYPKVRLPREQGGGEATVIAWLWARTVKCPNPACGAQMPLTSKWWLSTKKGKEAWVEPVVDSDSTPSRISFKVKTGKPTAEEIRSAAIGTAPINERGKKVQATFMCAVCGIGTAKGEYIDAEANAGRMGQAPLATVAQGRRNRLYLPFPLEHLKAVQAAESICLADPVAARVPKEPARGTFASNAQGRIYGFKTFGDYFTARQLVTLTTFSDLVEDAREKVLEDATAAGMADDHRGVDEGGRSASAYADAVATYLAFAVDKGANLWSSITSWMSDRGALRETFARQAIPMMWDFAEANPFSESGGNIGMFVERIADTCSYLVPNGEGHASQLDATSAVDGLRNPIVSTDPPYYDNIGYADLSDYFYVWLRRSLGSVYPHLFSTLLVPKSQELVATPYRFNGDRRRAQEFFEEGLGKAFDRMREKQHREYPLTVYYAFKQAESDGQVEDGVAIPIAPVSTGWETMLEGLLRSGFQITGTWPMRTESSGRALGQGTNALASSIVLVCRPRPTDAPLTTRRDFLNALKRELPDALVKLQHGNIAPVDLPQATIGPGMAIYSRYSKVVESDGSRMSVRTALALINQTLDEVLSEQEGEYDAETRFAISWFEQHGVGEGSFGDADNMARARNTSVGGLRESGLVEARGGKVRLLRREDLPDAWDPSRDTRLTVWETTQHMIRALDQQGEEGAAAILRQVLSYGDVARDLAYRLYVVCERKGWAQEALAYNGLVVAWPSIVARAYEAQAETQGTIAF